MGYNPGLSDPISSPVNWPKITPCAANGMNSPPTPPAAKVTSVAEILRPNSKAIKPSPFSGDTTHSIASIPGPIVNGEPNAASAEMARAAKRSPPITTLGTKVVFRD